MLKKIKNFRASILVVTMMILGIVLVTALLISIVSIKERKMSMGSSKSNQAYQNADNGVEFIMDKILSSRSDINNTVDTIASANGLTCSAGRLTGGNNFVIDLKKNNVLGDEVNAECGEQLTNIVAVKSIGTAGDSQRAIEAAVAATALTGTVTGGCSYDSTWGTATRCADSAGGTGRIDCQPGNTPRTFIYCNSHDCSWNSNGHTAIGICVKD